MLFIWEGTMRSLAVIIILILAVTVACKKSTEPPKGIPAGMHATIDGKTWSADSAAAWLVIITSGEGAGETFGALWGIKEVFQEASIIEFDFPELKKGTYTTAMGTLVAVYVHGYIEQNQQYIDYYFALPPQSSGLPLPGSASLTISKYDGEKAEGKFSFVAYDSLGTDSVKATSGTFNVYVSELSIDPTQTQRLQHEEWMLLPDISRKYFYDYLEME
jgi:hypothetical protein